MSFKTFLAFFKYLLLKDSFLGNLKHCLHFSSYLLVIEHAGFEPTSINRKVDRPKPLDERAIDLIFRQKKIPTNAGEILIMNDVILIFI